MLRRMELIEPSEVYDRWVDSSDHFLAEGPKTIQGSILILIITFLVEVDVEGGLVGVT